MNQTSKARRIQLGSGFFLLCLIGLSFETGRNAFTVSAQSQGIRRIDGETAYHLLAPSDEDVRLTSEHVTFDFTQNESNRYDQDSQFAAQMTTDYHITNDGASKTVTMGFPFVTSFADYPVKEISVSDDSGELPTSITYGKQVTQSTEASDPMYVNPRVVENQTLTQALLDTLPIEHAIDETLSVKVYHFDPSSITQQYAVLTFEADPDNTKIILDGGMNYQNQETWKNGDQTIKLSSYLSHSGYAEDWEISVIGDDIHTLHAYGENESALGRVTYAMDEVMTSQTMLLGDQISALVADNLELYGTHYDGSSSGEDSALFPLDADQALNLFEHQLANALQNTFCNRYIDLLSYAWSTPLLNVISFEVDLAPGDHLITVSYPYVYGFDFTYDPTVTEVNFVTNPGKQWQGTPSFTVVVIPPEEQLIYESTVPMEKQEDDRFVGSLAGFPEDNVSFSLCATANPTNATQNFFGFIKALADTFLFVTSYILTPLVLITGIVLAIVFTKKAKKKRLEKEKTNADKP